MVTQLVCLACVLCCGSFSLSGALGYQGAASFFGYAGKLTALATFHLTQTMTKSQTRSRAMRLDVDLSGVECRDVTDHRDRPMVPEEKVDRYRFISFYLAGATNHFSHFFDEVVDPEWLASNDEEARALRQIDRSRANKCWRVFHRVTSVERPALMDFGRDTRPLAAAPPQPTRTLDDLHADIADVSRQLAKLQQTVGKLDDGEGGGKR